MSNRVQEESGEEGVCIRKPGEEKCWKSKSLSAKEKIYDRTGNPLFAVTPVTRTATNTNSLEARSQQFTQNGRMGTMTKLGLLKGGKLMNWWIIHRSGTPVVCPRTRAHEFQSRFSREGKKKNHNGGARIQQFIIGDDETELDLSLRTKSFLESVNDQVRKRQKQSWKDATEDSDEHSVIWRMFMSSTLRASVFMGKNYSDDWHSIKNTKDLTMKQMFDISSKLVSEQDEIHGVQTNYWESYSWKYLSLLVLSMSSIFNAQKFTSFQILYCVLVRCTRTPRMGPTTEFPEMFQVPSSNCKPILPTSNFEVRSWNIWIDVEKNKREKIFFKNRIVGARGGRETSNIEVGVRNSMFDPENSTLKSKLRLRCFDPEDSTLKSQLRLLRFHVRSRNTSRKLAVSPRWESEVHRNTEFWTELMVSCWNSWNIFRIQNVEAQSRSPRVVVGIYWNTKEFRKDHLHVDVTRFSICEKIWSRRIVISWFWFREKVLFYQWRLSTRWMGQNGGKDDVGIRREPDIQFSVPTRSAQKERRWKIVDTLMCRFGHD